jgi:hypothetical protein
VGLGDGAEFAGVVGFATVVADQEDAAFGHVERSVELGQFGVAFAELVGDDVAIYSQDTALDS